jgi:hypothetical protein
MPCFISFGNLTLRSVNCKFVRLRKNYKMQKLKDVTQIFQVYTRWI